MCEATLRDRYTRVGRRETGGLIFWGRSRPSRGRAAWVRGRGEQVARDEQGVLHAHYARSWPTDTPLVCLDPANAQPLPLPSPLA